MAAAECARPLKTGTVDYHKIKMWPKVFDCESIVPILSIYEISVLIQSLCRFSLFSLRPFSRPIGRKSASVAMGASSVMAGFYDLLFSCLRGDKVVRRRQTFAKKCYSNKIPF